MEERGICQWQVPFCMGTRGERYQRFCYSDQKGVSDMAKSQYSVKVEPYLELIEGWTRDGLVMSQIAEKLGISKTTLYKYMQEHSELSERLKKGR